MKNLSRPPRVDDLQQGSKMFWLTLWCAVLLTIVPIVRSLDHSWEQAGVSEQFVRSGVFLYAATVIFSFLYAVLLPRMRMWTGLHVLFGAQVFWYALSALETAFNSTDSVGEGTRFVFSANEVGGTTVLLGAFWVVSLASYLGIRGFFFAETKAANRAEEVAFGVQASNYPFGLTIGILLVIGVLPLIVYGEDLASVVHGILGSRESAKEWAQGTFEGRWLSVIGRGCLVTAGGLSLFVLIFVKRGIAKLPYLATFGFAFLITYFDSGTRSWTMLIFGPGSIAMIHRLRWRSNGKAIAMGAGVVVALLTLTQLQAAFRDRGFKAHDIERMRVKIQDNDFFRETVYSLTYVGTYGPTNESVILLHLANPIPRLLWPSKPFPRSMREFSLWRRGYDEYLQGSSSMPSLVGQGYMDWGWWGVIEFAVFAGFFCAAMELIFYNRLGDILWELLAGFGLAWLFLCFRGMYPGFHYPGIIVIVLIMGRSVFRRPLPFRRRPLSLSKAVRSAR